MTYRDTAILSQGASASARCVTVSETIDAGPFEVAQRCCEFHTLSAWHPAFAECVVEGEGVGAVRTLDMGGAAVRERLEHISEDGLGYAYSVIQHPLLPTDARGYIEVREGETKGTSTLEWAVAFEAVPGPFTPSSTAELVRGLLAMGLTAAKIALETRYALWADDDGATLRDPPRDDLD